MVTHLVDTWWNTWWIVEVDVVVKSGTRGEFTGCPPGVPPGGMARPGPFSLYERTAFLFESGNTAFTARLLEWGNFASVKVDQVKLVAGDEDDEEVPTTLLKVQLPDSALAKVAAAPRGTTVKEQFGMSLIDEYGIPPGLDFRTSARIGEKRTPRKGESCVLPLI